MKHRSNLIAHSPESRSGQLTRGFTVVELLVTMVIFLVLLSAVSAMLVSGSRAYETNARSSEALQDSEAVLQLLRYDIGLAGYRGLERGQHNRPFTLDGTAGQTTVKIEAVSGGHSITVRYFEDRYIGTGDSGERRVTYAVDSGNSSLIRLEKNPIDGELDSALMVGNIESVEALSLVDLMRAEIRIQDLPSGIVPIPFAGMVLKVRFVDGRSWDLLISFTNPQTIEVS